MIWPYIVLTVLIALATATPFAVAWWFARKDANRLCKRWTAWKAGEEMPEVHENPFITEHARDVEKRFGLPPGSLTNKDKP